MAEVMLTCKPLVSLQDLRQQNPPSLIRALIAGNTSSNFGPLYCKNLMSVSYLLDKCAAALCVILQST
ncbi:MAG: hypothetical protein IJT20_04700 [Synergistaceae bacterium]|nr:hypothetical protein [Synergistaceae bacterium]